MPMLIRSNWPSTLGVAFHPEIPPACFTGPVWTAAIPRDSKAAHSASSLKVARKDSVGLVIMDAG